MKFTLPVIASLVATSTALFDKNQPWGKRDYCCVNVYQGIPDGSTVTAGQTIQVRFDRKPTGICPNPLAQYPGEDYSVWLYNNPVRDRDNLSFDHSVKITGGINEQTGLVDITIPNDLPDVQDGSVWYLRVSTTLVTAPQMPSLFNAAGPFTIVKA